MFLTQEGNLLQLHQQGDDGWINLCVHSGSQPQEAVIFSLYADDLRLWLGKAAINPEKSNCGFQKDFKCLSKPCCWKWNISQHGNPQITPASLLYLVLTGSSTLCPLCRVSVHDIGLQNSEQHTDGSKTTSVLTFLHFTSLFPQTCSWDLFPLSLCNYCNVILYITSALL